MFALYFGTKFCVLPNNINKKINKTHIKAQFESLYNQLSGLTCLRQFNDGFLRSRFVTMAEEISNFNIYSTAYPLTVSHLNALRNLTKNKTLIISRPDKGNGIVVMNRDDYVAKMLNIINDNRRFRRDDKQTDRSMKILHEIKILLKRMTDQQLIDDITAKTLTPTGCSIPRLYGLPKVHKTDAPLRPILSMIGSPQHRLAKFLAQVLKPVQEYYCKHQITDSFDLVHKLGKIELPDTHSYCIGSLDVTSLFTSVPVGKCIDIITRAVDSNDVNIAFDGSSLGSLLKICVTQVQFLFNNEFYSQIDEVAMGSPLGPILADIYVGYIERVTPSIDVDVFYFGRYVDDILVMAKNKESIVDLCNQLNSVDPDIQFTTELEVCGSIPFLDINIHKEDFSLKFAWYHKDTWTGTLLHYSSFVPFSWKSGLLKGFKNRILRICSPEFLQSALNELSAVFKNNGYPDEMISSCFF